MGGQENACQDRRHEAMENASVLMHRHLGARNYGCLELQSLYLGVHGVGASTQE